MWFGCRLPVAVVSQAYPGNVNTCSGFPPPQVALRIILSNEGGAGERERERERERDRERERQRERERERVFAVPGKVTMKLGDAKDRWRGCRDKNRLE